MTQLPIVGKIVTKVTGDKGSNELFFDCADGSRYRMHHEQDCCESVYIEDIAGDLDDLLHSPMLFAEESTSDTRPPLNEAEELLLAANMVEDSYEESQTWTFYRFGTNKGTVVIRWYGSSNGYYSESASFEELCTGCERTWCNCK